MIDAAYRIPTRAAMAALARDRQLLARLVSAAIGPMTGDLYRQHVSATTPSSETTTSVEAAREKYGRAARDAATP